ncbi:hypothetical protein GGI24_004235, partial [Coemansia furcata]
FYRDCTQSCELCLSFPGQLDITLNALVLPIAEDIILGNNWLREHDGQIHCQRDTMTFMHDGKKHTIRGINSSVIAETVSAATLPVPPPIKLSAIRASYTAGEVEEIGCVKLIWPQDNVVQVSAISEHHADQLHDLCACFASVLEALPTMVPPMGGPEMEIHIMEGKAPVS